MKNDTFTFGYPLRPEDPTFQKSQLPRIFTSEVWAPNACFLSPPGNVFKEAEEG